MCITPHSAMDNAIHSIWKSKGSFPTSCKQRCPQLHKTGGYTHYTQCRRLRNPTFFLHMVFLFYSQCHIFLFGLIRSLLCRLYCLFRPILFFLSYNCLISSSTFAICSLIFLMHILFSVLVLYYR